MSGQDNTDRRMVDALTAAGFTTAGPGRGYTRMGWPGSDLMSGSLLVPTDPTALGFQEALDAVKATLLGAARRGDAAHYALDLHQMEVPE